MATRPLCSMTAELAGLLEADVVDEQRRLRLAQPVLDDDPLDRLARATQIGELHAIVLPRTDGDVAQVGQIVRIGDELVVRVDEGDGVALAWLRNLRGEP